MRKEFFFAFSGNHFMKEYRATSDSDVKVEEFKVEAPSLIMLPAIVAATTPLVMKVQRLKPGSLRVERIFS